MTRTEDRIMRVVVWLLFYFPKLSWWEFNRRLFWVRAIQQAQAARKRGS